MKLVISKGIILTEEQQNEIKDVIMEKPDMGWNYNYITGKNEKRAFHELSGLFADYEYTVDVLNKIITIVGVYNEN